MQYENIIIRKANQSDIEQIAAIKIKGWKTAYEDMIDKEILDNMDIKKEIENYTNRYSLDNVFVADNNGEILGFCRVYDYDDSPYEDKEIDCEIREIYVRPDIKRMGIGSKIFNYVFQYFKQKNKNKLYLGVFEHHYKSRNFYEKMGGILGKKDNLEIKGKYYSTVSYTYNLRGVDPNERKQN